MDQVLTDEDEDGDFSRVGSIDDDEDYIVISDFPWGLKLKSVGLIVPAPNALIFLGLMTWDLKKLGFEEREACSIEGSILGLISCGVFLLENLDMLFGW